MKEFMALGLLFIGIAIGSMNPVKDAWIIPMIIATIFIGLDLYFEMKYRNEEKS